MEAVINKQWSDDMGEISGFGGSYEDGCRAMFLARVKWLDEHPNADPVYRGMEGVFGLVNTNNSDAEELDKAVMDAKVFMSEYGKEVRCGDECTGAMHHAVINHLLYYKGNGWEKYCEEMRKK